jgi:hypothetical protein
MLDSLPSKRLELPFVLVRAAQSSDSFKAAAASLLTTDVTRLQAESALAWRPFAQFSKVDDEREAGNSFSPNRIQNQSFSLGVATAFRTGTRVQLEVSQGSNSIAFPTPGFGPFDYYETRSTVSVTQSLLADAFGQSTRALQRSAAHASEAQALTARESLEDWTLGLVRLYYGAWLAQAQVRSSIEGYERKLRLKQLLEIQARRGPGSAPGRKRHHGYPEPKGTKRAQASGHLARSDHLAQAQSRVDPHQPGPDPGGAGRPPA